MMPSRWYRLLLPSAAMLLAPGRSPVASSPARAEELALTHATVLTMGPAGRLRDQTILIRDGVIVELDATGKVVLPRGVTVIDARGRFVMPGLADMHVHNLVRDRWLFLGYGITTARGMWGTPSTAALRDSAEAGLTTAARMHLASPGLDARPGRWPLTQFVDSLSEVAPTVSRLKREGWQWLKIYSSLALPVYDSIVQAARAVGVPILGHVPFAVPVEHALAAGQLTIEHLSGYERAMSGRIGITGWALATAARDPELVRLTVTSGAWNCPTMAITDAINRDRNPGVYPGLTRRRREFLSALYRGGARLLVGTDSGIDIVPAGETLSLELAEFIAAGIPADTALWIATRGAAEFLGEEHGGMVAPGQRADLLLLEGDPAADLRVLRTPAGLVFRGEWYPAARLARWREGRP